MNRETRFMVTIVSSDKITTDEDKKEMAQNIADAIVKQAQEGFIAPENSDVSAEIVYVTEWYQNDHVIEHI